MNEPQVWVLIGVFATGLFGMLTIMSTLFVRVIRSEIGGLRSELTGEIGGMRGELTGEIGGLRSEVRSIHQRIDRLDRDINALMKHTFGIDRD